MKRIALIILSIVFLSGCVTTGKPKRMSINDVRSLSKQSLDSQISALPAITPDGADYFYIVDMDDTSSKKALLSSLAGIVYQAYDSDLATWAGITPSANMQSFAAAADYSAMRTAISLVPGTHIQGYHAALTSLAALTYASTSFVKMTGANTFALDTGTYQPLESTLTDIADGTITENLVNVANPWAINEGGTGGSTAVAAKAALDTGLPSKSFCIGAAVATDDFLVWRAPVDITITDIYGVLLTGVSVVGALDECDSAGANCVAVDADITFNGGLDQDDGALTNGTIDAGDWIMWHTTSIDTPGFLTVTFDYTID